MPLNVSLISWTWNGCGKRSATADVAPGSTYVCSPYPWERYPVKPTQLWQQVEDRRAVADERRRIRQELRHVAASLHEGSDAAQRAAAEKQLQELEQRLDRLEARLNRGLQ